MSEKQGVAKSWWVLGLAVGRERESKQSITEFQISVCYFCENWQRQGSFASKTAPEKKNVAFGHLCSLLGNWFDQPTLQFHCKDARTVNYP